MPLDLPRQALLLYVSAHGYEMGDYDVVTNFPTRNLNSLNISDSLLALGLFPRETVYVQQKSIAN